MRGFSLLCSLFLSVLCFSSSCHGNQGKIEVLGVGECVDCKDYKFKTSQAFSGLRVTIDCKLKSGEFKRRGSGELNAEGKFKVSLPKEVLKDGKLNEDCYAQLHSASSTPCPSHQGMEASKIIANYGTNGKLTLSASKNIKFSSALCTSAFLWPYFKYPPLPKNPWKKPFPKFFGHPLPFYPVPEHKSFPSIPIYKKPLPPIPVYKPIPPVPIYKPPVFKKPLPPPIPIYKPPIFKKPLPPPIPIYKPPVYKKPLPPPVPIYKPPVYKKPLPPPVPIYKPPVFEKPLPPPLPIYKHPIFKKPFPPIFKKPFLPPPFPYYKPPLYKKPWPPIPHVTLPKLPPIPKPPLKDYYFNHPKIGLFPPLPPYN